MTFDLDFLSLMTVIGGCILIIIIIGLDNTFDRNKPKLKKLIGFRNIVTDGKQWKYLLFYDVDNQSEETKKLLSEVMNKAEISFIIYTTKHGIHVVGLTPMNLLEYATYFAQLNDLIPEYYSGQTIRLSRKEGENQELLGFNFDYPMLKNVVSIYQKRFPELYVNPDTRLIEGYSLVFEKFWSVKK